MRLLERLVPRYAAGLQNILRNPLTLLGVAGLDHIEHLLRLWVVRHRMSVEMSDWMLNMMPPRRR